MDLDSPAPERWREIVPAGPDAIQGFVLAGGSCVVHSPHDVTSRLLRLLPRRQVARRALSASRVRAAWARSRDAVTAIELLFDFASVHRSAGHAIAPTSARARSRRGGRRQRRSTPRPTRRARSGLPRRTEPRVLRMFASHRSSCPVGQRPVRSHGLRRLQREHHCLRFGERPRGGWSRAASTPWPTLRGGGEFGEEWHRAGMLDKKQNVFDDFIARRRVARRERLHRPRPAGDPAAASNGGLSWARSLTQRPELYRAVLCEFPDLDMIGYHRFEQQPASPARSTAMRSNAEQFKFLAAALALPEGEGRRGVSGRRFSHHGGMLTQDPAPPQARKMTGAPAVPRFTALGSRSSSSTTRRPATRAANRSPRRVEDQSPELGLLPAWQLGMEPPGGSAAPAAGEAKQ